MTDYSDIFFLMGAMIMFSFLTMSVNRTLLMNDMNRVGDLLMYNGMISTSEKISNTSKQTAQNNEENNGNGNGNGNGSGNGQGNGNSD